MNELTYEPWLTEGNKYKQRYYLYMSLGLMIWAAVTAWFYMGEKYSFLQALIIGFAPYFVFYLIGLSFYEKWQSCEDKYNHHIPFIDVKKTNVVLCALEFEPGYVIAHYFKFDGTKEAMKIPSGLVKILPASEEVDSMQTCCTRNNFTEKEEWNYVHIYLTQKMQEKLLDLSANLKS